MDLQQNAGAELGRSSPVPCVYIVVLNWNGWRDTIECLESLLRLDYPDYKIIVCDNASSDGSLENIRAWALGELLADCKSPILASLVATPVPKPLRFIEIPSASANAAETRDARLILIQTGANLGFAGGNNVGLRYALQQSDCGFAWILNNDTIVRADALSALIRHSVRQRGVGITGSKILYYHDPDKVQALGGSVYNKWTARGGHIGDRMSDRDLPESGQVVARLAYVMGVSMLVSRSFLQTVGLMQEDYFLYFEELDWAERARGRFTLDYCPESVVYHKEGVSTGSNYSMRRRSITAEYYGTLNRMRFTRRFHPYALPSVFGVICGTILLKLLLGMWKNAAAVFRGLFSLGLPDGRGAGSASSMKGFPKIRDPHCK